MAIPKIAAAIRIEETDPEELYLYFIARFPKNSSLLT
jgi:hypothetical protein